MWTRWIDGRALLGDTEDSEIDDQFTTQTYTLSNGNVVYSKGNDHIIDAVRCAMLARERERLDEVREEMGSLVPVVTDPVFF